MKTINELEQEAKQAREDAIKLISEYLPDAQNIADKLILASVAMVTYQFAQAEQLRNGEVIRIDDSNTYTFSVPIDATRRAYVYANGEIRVVPLDSIEESLPEVSQEERDSDGWSDWNGDGHDCPIPENLKIEARFANGDINNGEAGQYRWHHVGNGYDLIAYRIVKGE